MQISSDHPSHQTGYFAEVIQSSISSMKAQTWKWDTTAPFGSLVCIEQQDKTYLGLVYQSATQSIDSSRLVVAYQKTEQELRKDQPQIFELLRTTFSCLIVGYIHANKLYYQVASDPLRIHAFVRLATDRELAHFFSQSHYLQILFTAQLETISLDELLLGLLKYLSDKKLLSAELLHEFLASYSLLTGNDYRRMKLFLQRAQSLISYESTQSISQQISR